MVGCEICGGFVIFFMMVYIVVFNLLIIGMQVDSIGGFFGCFWLCWCVLVVAFSLWI